MPQRHKNNNIIAINYMLNTVILWEKKTQNTYCVLECVLGCLLLSLIFFIESGKLKIM